MVVTVDTTVEMGSEWYARVARSQEMLLIPDKTIYICINLPIHESLKCTGIHWNDSLWEADVIQYSY